MKSVAASIVLLASAPLLALAGGVVSDPYHPPHTTENGQTGYNDCYKYKDSSSSKCQTVTLNSLEDFCIFGMIKKQAVGEGERTAVAYCTKAGHGARLIPKGALKGVQFLTTPSYIQITGLIDQTKIDIPSGDDGGELDPHGADGLGNPIGGVVLVNKGGKLIQSTEWNSFLGSGEFSIRACFPGPNATKQCPHIYDLEGSEWNSPGRYAKGFLQCKAADTLFPGVYGGSTFYQGQAKTPAAHPAAKSSSCRTISTIAAASYPTAKAKRFEA